MKKTRKKKHHESKIKSPGTFVFDFTGSEDWSNDELKKVRREALTFYTDECSYTDFLPDIWRWMWSDGYTKEDMENVKKSSYLFDLGVLGKYVRLVMNGHPDECDAWPLSPISVRVDDLLCEAISEGHKIRKVITSDVESVSIKERMLQQLESIIVEFEDVLSDAFLGKTNKEFDPYKRMLEFEPQIKAAHARVMKDAFNLIRNEVEWIVKWDDGDIKEAYPHLTTLSRRKKLHDIMEKIDAACDMIIKSNKVKRKPRKPKEVSKVKLVQKLNYQQQDKTLGLVSLNPIDLIGAKEVWVFNTKYRKLGKYVADELIGSMTVKGSTLQDFDAVKSIQKTLRKPEEQLKEFSKSGKVALRTFMEDIKTKEQALTGRFNTDTIILRII